MPRSRIRHRRLPAVGQPRGTRRIASLLLSGLLLGLTLGTAGSGQGATLALQPEHHPYAAHIVEASQRFAIPEHWIRAVIRVESAGDPRAVSSAGAMGLMQVMPDTWAELSFRHRLGADPFAPLDNILAGTAYLHEMFERYGNTAAMLAAYNAGPARYDAYLSGGRALPAETRVYVAAVTALLDGNPPSVASARPADWRETALFVSTSDANNVQTDGGSSATPAPADGFAPASSDAIFVSRSGAESAP